MNPRHEKAGEPEIIVCECKSLNEAVQDDFDKLEEVCAKMPEAIACLTTWKDDFSQDEKIFAQKLWDKGYEIVLLARSDIESREIFFEGVDDDYKYIRDFVDLAHATRQKYLESDDR